MAYKWAKCRVTFEEDLFPVMPTTGATVTADSSLYGFGSYNFSDGKYYGVLPTSLTLYNPTSTVFVISEDGKSITKYVGQGVSTVSPPYVTAYGFSKSVKLTKGELIEYVFSDFADTYPQNAEQDGFWYSYVSEEALNTYANINGMEKKVASVYVNIDGIAKKATEIYCNINGVAKKST